MHPVIYLPQQNTANAAHLAEVGLADHAPTVQMTALDGRQPLITGEPAAGVVCTWGSSRPKTRALPSLTWLPAMPLDGLPARRYFVGVDPAHPPQPHELLKPQVHPGSPVMLGDNRLWVVPHASELPFDLIRNAQTGTIEYQPRPAFYAFWCKAESWQVLFSHALETGTPLPDVEEQVEFLEEALRINYRLCPELIAWLRLFSTGPHGTLRATLTACLHVQPGGA